MKLCVCVCVHSMNQEQEAIPQNLLEKSTCPPMQFLWFQIARKFEWFAKTNPLICRIAKNILVSFLYHPKLSYVTFSLAHCLDQPENSYKQHTNNKPLQMLFYLTAPHLLCLLSKHISRLFNLDKTETAFQSNGVYSKIKIQFWALLLLVFLFHTIITIYLCWIYHIAKIERRNGNYLRAWALIFRTE